jgi:hypothetical protein
VALDKYPNSSEVTFDIATLPDAFDTNALDDVKFSVEIDDAAPVSIGFN